MVRTIDIFYQWGPPKVGNCCGKGRSGIAPASRFSFTKAQVEVKSYDIDRKQCADGIKHPRIQRILDIGPIGRS